MEVSDINIGKQVREKICRLMADYRSDSGDIFLQLPTFYSTGANVVARIKLASKRFTGTEERYTVDDAGAGYAEAEALGVARTYSLYAREAADRNGINFDDHRVTARDVSRETLAWAAVTVAGVSTEAISISLQKVEEVERENDADALVKRLVTVFPKASVVGEAPIVGASNTRWRVDALLDWQGRKTIFEAVSAHHNSIYAAATKLGDIKALESAPGRVAVVRSKDALRTYENVLSRLSFVIEKNSAPAAYKHAAVAGKII